MVPRSAIQTQHLHVRDRDRHTTTAASTLNLKACYKKTVGPDKQT